MIILKSLLKKKKTKIFIIIFTILITSILLINSLVNNFDNELNNYYIDYSPLTLASNNNIQNEIEKISNVKKVNTELILAYDSNESYANNEKKIFSNIYQNDNYIGFFKASDFDIDINDNEVFIYVNEFHQKLFKNYSIADKKLLITGSDNTKIKLTIKDFKNEKKLFF